MIIIFLFSDFTLKTNKETFTLNVECTELKKNNFSRQERHLGSAHGKNTARNEKSHWCERLYERLEMERESRSQAKGWPLTPKTQQPRGESARWLSVGRSACAGKGWMNDQAYLSFFFIISHEWRRKDYQQGLTDTTWNFFFFALKIKPCFGRETK